MKQYNAKNVLNIALAGHSGAGKTSLAESMLFLAGASDRLGKISEGNTICDFDAEEIRRQTSVMTAVAPLEWKNKKINLIDTPGLFDFEGGVCEGMRAAETVLITVSGKAGVAVGTEKAVKAADKQGLAKVFFVNGLCDESARFYRVFENLKASFGPSVCPVVVPFIVDGQANCYINLLDYKAYSYDGGKVSEVPMPDMGDRLEEEKADQHDANGVGDAQPDGPGDAVGPAGPVVISHNGHHAVVQTEDRHEEKGLQLEVYPQHRCGGGGEGDQNLVHAEHHD